jgi:DNA-binding transcriptional LysR family regulator
MLDPRRLRLLEELSRRGTIAAVAEALRFTPSTVSEQLATLEREAGVSLLERGPRSVRLTEAGRALAARAPRILDGLDEARVEAQTVGGLDRGTVCLATFASAGATVSLRAVEALEASHPELTVRLVDAEPADALAALRRGDVDVAVSYAYSAEPLAAPDGLEVAALFDDPVVLCVPPGEDPEGLEDLREATFTAGPPGAQCYVYTREVCHAAGYEPRLGFETEDVAFTCALVETAHAYAFMPEMLLRLAAASPRTLALPELPPRKVFAAHRRAAGGLRAVRETVAALVTASEDWAVAGLH